MAGVPWTKFQDFYLRLGFLKVLVAALSPFRRSVTNDAVYQKLRVPLFKPAGTCPELAKRASAIDWYTPAEIAEGKPYILESLLVADNCPSWLYAVTTKTIYKILDWGHDVQFVGRGNQITERGLLLRTLLPKEAEEFFTSDGAGWNPFIISPLERLFFLFHLTEIDRVTVALIDLLADLDESEVLESADAAQLTCKALFGVLEDARSSLSPRYLPEFRTAYDLAKTIARELEMPVPGGSGSLALARSLPRAPKVIRRTGGLVKSGSHRKKPNKNADHQTIPRFEQLVDLGFLQKPSSESKEPTRERPPQRRWRYQPTQTCRLWAAAKKEAPSHGNWLWTGFAQTVVESLVPEQKPGARATMADAIRFFADAYDAVHRPVGHTPFDSVALHAMLRAAVEGYAIEIKTFHNLMLKVKKRNLLPDHVFFASGNDIDTMFINFRRGYRERLIKAETSLSEGVSA